MGQTGDNRVEQCTHAPEPPQIAVVADVGVTTGGTFPNVHAENSRSLVSEPAREYRQPRPLGAKPCLHIPIVAAERHFRVRKYAFHPDGVWHLGEGDVHRDDPRPRPIEPQHTFKSGLLTRKLALKRKGLLFNALDVNQDGVAFIRQNKAIGCALEEGVTHGTFQRTKAASHCWLGLAEAARGAAERPFARDRQENSEVAPLHCLGGLQTKSPGLPIITLLPMR